MPKGRNKGFQYYMCKKFFHPSNPQNLERVFIAKQRLEQKEKAEVEKKAEYEREQERWNSRNALSKAQDKDKVQLSFMYDPPVGMRKEEKEEAVTSARSGKEKKEDFKFEWQRKAPRESYAKDDPNITDHPFGIQVQFTKCMRCQVWGHSHTDRNCPKFGKAKDHEEPIHPVDQKKLFRDLENQGMKFTSYGAWDNGKMGKRYDLVYSSNDESDDILVDMVIKMRKKKRAKHRSSSSERKQFTKRKKRKDDEQYKKSVLSKVDSILAPKKEPKFGKRTLDKIDDILFSDIARSGHGDKKNFLSEVDKILDIRNKSESEDAATSESDNEYSEEEDDKEEEDEEEDSEDLTESEMRLLNLINIKKIDMKHNFPSLYPDTTCHFCREEELSTHLAVCPVYDRIMRGTEFTDIKSKNTKIVKTALGNILAALKQRSQALSVTSVGRISRQNMRLITMEEQGDNKRNKERDRRVEEILELS